MTRVLNKHYDIVKLWTGIGKIAYGRFIVNISSILVKRFSVLFQTIQYLVKWKDFSIADCTWEPQRHLPEHVIVNFVPTQIDEDRLKVFSVAFERAVHGHLKSKNPVGSVYVDLDIYRYLFGDVSSKLCDLQDFTPLKLSDNWFYILNRDGTGKKLKFPIKLTARLCVRKMYVKQTVPIVKCNIYSCTEACTVEDL